MNASQTQTCYLSLGSNLGDRQLNIRTAIERLDAHPEIVVTQVSRLYETAPVGYVDQPDFYNCCIELQTTLSPHNLLKMTRSTEVELGRQRDIRWGPRTIDIDILLIEQQVMDTDDLTVPHPRMDERAFVLLPLADIAPYIVHPVTQTNVSIMASQVCGKEGVFLCQIPLASGSEPTGS